MELGNPETKMHKGNSMNTLNILHFYNLCYLESRIILDKPTQIETADNVIHFLDTNMEWHRIKLPAAINAEFTSYYWRKHGSTHNTYGPAYLDYSSGYCMYYLNGTRYSEPKWEIERLKCKDDNANF